MSELPRGWEWTSIGEIAATSLGKMLDKKKATGLHPTPYLRNINVRWGGFDLSDLAEMDIRPEELDRVLAQPGDVIACEGGEPGRAAVWRGPGTIALQKALHRIRPTSAISPHYLAHLLHHLALSRRLEPLLTGTTIRHLPQEKLRLVPVPLPPRAEQERIVAAIEEHLSRLTAAVESLARVKPKSDQLVWGPAERVWADRALRKAVLGEVGAIVTGTTPKSSSPGQWGEDYMFATPGDLIHGGRVTGTTRRLSAHGFRAARPLPAGSVLVTCIGATLGKSAVTEVPMAFNQQINGILPYEGVARPGFLLALLSCPTGQRHLWAASSSTTMPILNKGRFAKLRVPMPPLEVQQAIETAMTSTRNQVQALNAELDRAASRSAALRRAILAAAFSGQLVPKHPDDEPASILLDRVRAEGAAAPTKRTRKAKAS